MSGLVFFARSIMLKNQINDKNYQLMQKQQELQDLQAYTAAIADGEVSLQDLTTAPAGMFGQMTNYMVASHNYASGAAQQNMAYLQGTNQGQAQGQDAQAQAQYQQLVFKNLYDTQKSQFLKAEQARLQVKEKAMDNEILKLENQLKTLEAEYQQVSQASDKAAQSEAPKYVA